MLKQILASNTYIVIYFFNFNTLNITFTLTELELIQNLQAHPSSHDKALSFIFQSKVYRDPIIVYLRSKGVNNIDVEELWTDIVVKFSALVRDGKYEHQNKLGGYLKNLARYMMLNHFRDQGKTIIEEITSTIEKDHHVEAITMHHKELKGLLSAQLDELGEVCKSILTLWSLDYSMKEIMEKLKLISVEATRKRKHKCLNSLLTNVRGNSSFKNLLKEYY
jgi:hypothetical protein